MKINFKCPNRINVDKCVFCDSKGMLWGLREEDEEIVCSTDPTIICQPDSVYIPPSIGERMSPDQVSADRSKISKRHFQKEVLPTIDKDSTKWHNKKDK